MAKRSTAPARSGDKSLPEESLRLIQTRERLGFSSQSAFAVFLGVGLTRLNRIENGDSISRDIATIMCRKIPGMTLDWIYFGNAEGLPLQLARELGVFDVPGKFTKA